jgi:hypothetical protein
VELLVGKLMRKVMWGTLGAMAHGHDMPEQAWHADGGGAELRKHPGCTN